MQIDLQAYPCFGGPLDGGNVLTASSRVWVHVNSAELDALLMQDVISDSDGDISEAENALERATALFAPDDCFADAVCEVRASGGEALSALIADIDGVYVHDDERGCLNWVQLKLTVLPREGTLAWKYQRLASLLVRDRALRIRLEQFHDEPDHRVHLDVLMHFTTDLGLIARARAYYAYKMSRRWDPPDLLGT